MKVYAQNPVIGQFDNKTKTKTKPVYKETSDTFETKIKKDASNDGKFTVKEASKNFLKGVFSPLKAIVKHPLLTMLTVAATASACCLIPVLSPVMTIGFGALSIFQLAKGCYTAAKEYKNGNYDNAEKAFINIGQGTVGTASAALGIKQNAKVAAQAKAMNKLGVKTLSQEQKTAICDNIKDGNHLNALKETLSLFTTKEGRSAVISQFKPSMIKERATEIINFFKGETIHCQMKTNREVFIEEFKKSPEGIRRANLTDAQIEDEVTSLFNKAFDELGVPKDLRPTLKIEKTSVTNGGSYQASNHTLSYNSEAYKAGIFDMNDVIMHEATHCKEAILRACLPQNNVDDVVSAELINRILNGESEEILLKGGFLGSETMTPPKLTPAMKEEFAAFAKEELYTKNELFRHNLLNAQTKRDASLLEQTFSGTYNKLKAILDKNPDFVSQYETYDDALNVMLDYSLAHNVRFNAFAKTEIPNLTGTSLSADEILAAENSLKNFISTVEGNTRVQGLSGLFAGQNAFNQYQFSPEEVLAQQNGNKFLIRNLMTKMKEMKEAGTLTPDDEAFMTNIIDKAKATIDYKTKGLEYYEAYTALLNNPKDETLIKSVELLEKELSTLKKIISPVDPNDVAKILIYFDGASIAFPNTAIVTSLNGISNIKK